jgi:hypothetical protein
LFLLGLVLVDFGVGYFCDRLASSHFWHNTTVTKLAASENIDVLAIGDCRTAVQIDPEALSRRLGATVFNAGKVEEGLGYMDFTLNLALSKYSPKVVLIQVDAITLTQDYAGIRQELVARVPRLNLLSEGRRNYLIDRYQLGLSRILSLSGFWRYRGQGEIVFTSLARLIKNQMTLTADGYDPVPSSKNVLSALAPGSKTFLAIKDGVSKTLTPSPYAIDTISTMIEAVKMAGGVPVLLVTPMHYYDSTDEVVAIQKREASLLSKKHKIPLLFYHDNNSAMSKEGELWSDLSHLNEQGAKVFSEMLATDLEKLNIINH